VALFAVVGTSEVFSLAERGGVRAVRWAGALGALSFPVLAFVWTTGYAPSGVAVALGGAAWLILVMMVATATRMPRDRPLAAVAVTVFGASYAGGMPAFLIALRHGSDALAAGAATALVFLPLVLTWICDTLAMAGGALIGGRKLAPVLSPNKTWAGAVSGSLGALALAPLYGMLVLQPLGVTLGWWRLALFGFIISIAGQAGDVTESMFKREVGVKDSGSFFPGHGGVLDRLDSLYWVLPTSVLLLVVFGIL
jgi:phosphatidate cytidylyltransferase